MENDDVLGATRRELRKVVDVLVSEEDIRTVLIDQVLKRDALEGPAAEEAVNRVRRAQNRPTKQVGRTNGTEPSDQALPPPAMGVPGTDPVSAQEQDTQG